MPKIVYQQKGGEPVVVNLKDPYWAALLAWLWPGAGHFYQGRFAKGFLFMICVLSTFFFGLGLGQARVVYASFRENDVRWQYICQLGTGAVAMPAMVQAMKTKNGADPFFVLCERYPEDHLPANLRFRRITEENNKDDYQGRTLKDGFMAPPAGPQYVNDPDTLGRWHSASKHFFEIGTLYTVVAGLLNLLAIYDAFCGPSIMTESQKERISEKKSEADKARRRAKVGKGGVG